MNFNIEEDNLVRIIQKLPRLSKLQLRPVKKKMKENNNSNQLGDKKIKGMVARVTLGSCFDDIFSSSCMFL